MKFSAISLFNFWLAPPCWFPPPILPPPPLMGLVGLSLSYAMQITNSLNLLIRQSSQIENNMVSVERIKEYQTSLPREADWTVAGDPGPDQWPLR